MKCLMDVVLHVLRGCLFLTWAIVEGSIWIKKGEMHMWNAAKTICQSNKDGGMLFPFENKSTSQNASDMMVVDQMYWVDGIIYNMGCTNGECEVFYVQHIDGGTHRSLECISGADSPRIKTTCNVSSLFNVSSLRHISLVTRILKDEKRYIIGNFHVDGVRQDCFSVVRRSSGTVQHYYAPCSSCLFPAICLRGTETYAYLKTVSHRMVNESVINNMMYSAAPPTTVKSYTIKGIRTIAKISTKHVSTNAYEQTFSSLHSSPPGMSTSTDDLSARTTEVKVSSFASSKEHKTSTTPLVVGQKTDTRLSRTMTTRKRETTVEKPSDYKTDSGESNITVIVVVAILLTLMIFTAVGVGVWIKRQKEEDKRLRRSIRSEIWPDFTQQASMESSVGSYGNISPNVIFEGSLQNERS